MPKTLLAALFAVLSVMTLMDPRTVNAAADPAICLKACIDQNGAAQKKSCALQCGIANSESTGSIGNSYGQQKQTDCGTVYKQCLAQCKPGEENCRSACRQARTSCY